MELTPFSYQETHELDNLWLKGGFPRSYLAGSNDDSFHLKKRQVKTPKIYLRDSGIFHSLLNIHNFSNLRKHPKIGASWEGFALEEIIRKL